MAEFLFTHGYFLYENPRKLQLVKLYARPIELRWANRFINLRRPKRESL